MRSAVHACLALLITACSGSSDEPAGEDLSVGDLSIDDAKADGQWGAALTCKSIPSYPALPSPQITISLDGLTLHLVDRTVGFDKVFPIGPGAIDTDTTSATFGESLSYWPLQAYRTSDFALHPATNTACKFWWTDPETHQKLPVFAGLPFLSWSGSYAIHGPIDNYRAPNGGNLRRGFVSHGCVRMEAAGILEVYARVKDAATVPVHVQRERERLTDGTRAEVESPWVGAECASDADCPYTSGFCHHNAYSRRGFCSARCTRSCADRAGAPPTFCVADPDAAGQGMCVPKMITQDYGCRPFDAFQPQTVGRNGQPSVKATVCLPGSPGWVGDRCLADADCKNGTSCGATGLCTEACTRYCPDEPGAADTMCVAQACERQCSPSSNASECSGGTSCVLRDRSGGGASHYVCE